MPESLSWRLKAWLEPVEGAPESSCGVSDETLHIEEPQEGSIVDTPLRRMGIERLILARVNEMESQQSVSWQLR